MLCLSCTDVYCTAAHFPIQWPEPLQPLLQIQPAAETREERQDLPCTCLAHNELESVNDRYYCYSSQLVTIADNRHL